MRPRPCFRVRPFFRRPAAPPAAGFAPVLAAILALALAAAPPAFANSYKRGHYSCPDFQKHEKKYRSDPTGGYAVAYALCLITRGGEDVRALGILDAEIAKGDVSAAFDKAVYVASGGTMDKKNLDDRYYNEAYEAYAKVLLLINLRPDYPEGFWFTEAAGQHELEAYINMVAISYMKFLAGLNGTHNAGLLRSPTYKGKRDLKLHPKHQAYTLDNMEKTIEHADRCANLPRKRHFKPLLYKRTTAYCRVMRGYLKEFIPLEQKRLTLLDNEACAGDIEQCAEYREVLHNKIVPLVEKREKEASNTWLITD